MEIESIPVAGWATSEPTESAFNYPSLGWSLLERFGRTLDDLNTYRLSTALTDCILEVLA